MTSFLYPSGDLGLPETHYELKKRVTTVGRHPNNDISLLLESVSRFHAKIEERDGSWLLTDLNSSNGTFINGERLAGPRPVREKDVITFGRADFTFSRLSPQDRKASNDDSSQKPFRTDSHTSSVNIVGDEDSSSTILSTQLNVESTPYPGTSMLDQKVDVSDLRRANEKLLTLYKLSEVIRSSASREEILSNVMDLIFEVLPADRAVILTLEPPDACLEPQIVRFRDGERSSELTISKTIVQKCLDERVAVLSRDARIDSRFNASESIMASDIRSAMCIPLISKKSIIGILFIDTKESVRAFNEEDLAFVTSFGNDLAMTLDNLNLAQENIKNERLAAVGQTIAGLAHNIKNILQLARGGIELMDGAIQKRNQTDIEAFWPVVRRGIDRMQSLTQEMLDYSRQTTPQLVEASVNAVIVELVSSFQQDRVESGVTIELDLSPDIPVSRIDPDGLTKALMNLLSNSVDAFDGVGGTIEVSTSYADGTTYIIVSDNGKGIARDKLARIFQPFFTTKGSKGTGLGLSMTKKYIEDQGGRITVDSEEGRGTRFTIALLPMTTRIEFDIEDSAPYSTQGS